MITITEKDNKIYIIQDSGEYEKSLASEILILLLVTLTMRLVYLDSHETNGFLYLLFYIFVSYTFNLTEPLTTNTLRVLES